MMKKHAHSHDHSQAPILGRREFLCHCCLGGAATAAMLAGINRPALAGELTVKATHGTGLCNMAIFLAHARKMTEKYGISLEFVNAPTSGDIAAIFGSGQVDLSSIPYSNFFTLIDKGAPVKIVAGTGAEGCVIVAQPGIDSAEKLRGKSLGTFQADTLEVLPYDWVTKHGGDWAKMDVKFLGSSPEIVQAFVNGAVDSICHIEPYATQALREVKGAHMLSDGTDIYGPYYTDCVIAVSERLIKADRDAVKNIIRTFMMAQHESEKDRMQACKDTVGTYYKTDFATLIDASTKQFLMIDQRRHQKFMIDRSQSMMELGYTRKPIDESAFDWSMLEEVIAEEPELYRSLIVV
jgi:NitT/TauT family transport system substrate-binding protein